MDNNKYYGYKSWEEYLLDNPSYPIVNNKYLFGICNESRKLMLPKETTIAFHKRKLGKENFCWNKFGKNYIWQYPELRIFVNKDGRDIEWLSSKLRNDFNIIEPLKIYIKDLGIEESLENLHFDNYKFP